MKIVFDIGGTNTRVAAVRDEKTFAPPLTYPTPQNFYDGIIKLAATARELAGGEKITAASGGIAGSFNFEHDTLVAAPHLHDWMGKPLKEKIREALEGVLEVGAPIILENDAALGALGEAVVGAGRGHKIVAYLTVGTGVGGARVVDGALEPHTKDSEPGHKIYEINGAAQELETLVSGSAFEKIYGRPPAEITETQLWLDAARYLALGVHEAIISWTPDVVVLGGSMITKPRAIPLNEIISETQKLFELENSEKKLPPIIKAKLGDESVLCGALLTAEDK